MFSFLKKSRGINIPEVVDEIENAIYTYLKTYGFKKYGRTLHRFVSEDVSQVIHFQSGNPSEFPFENKGGKLCVNLGIRIPECEERTFHPTAERKKYYHEYECTIRSRLGTVKGKQETWYDLSKNSEKIIKNILQEIKDIVIPAFEVLSSREAILLRRKDYPLFDTASNTLLLDECMIYGHLGDMERAKELFESYYNSVVAEYNNKMKNGHKHYLKKGERILFMGQDITAEKNGYVVLYGANHDHIDYLDELSVKLGLR